MDSFGRLFVEDERDNAYPMTAAIRPFAMPGVTYRYWNDNQWWGNQGPHPYCVAYAWMHWAEDGPVTHKAVPPPMYDPVAVYNRAQQIDQWPGENYDGTSVRAGAKVLQEHGIISNYYWARNVQDIIDAILSVGPVVVGTKWYSNMSRPDAYYILHPTGSVVGGHAYILNGVSISRGLFRVKNSWGRDWGRSGRAYLAFDDMAQLLADQGEACLAIEIE